MAGIHEKMTKKELCRLRCQQIGEAITRLCAQYGLSCSSYQPYAYSKRVRFGIGNGGVMSPSVSGFARMRRGQVLFDLRRLNVSPTHPDFVKIMVIVKGGES